MANNSRPVYSTESGRLCPACGQPVAACRCKQARTAAPQPGRPVTIWRERKGRAGKEVTVVRDLPLNAMELQLLASALKKHCGCGGSVSPAGIEIQGDQRQKILQFLAREGYQAKLAGA